MVHTSSSYGLAAAISLLHFRFKLLVHPPWFLMLVNTISNSTSDIADSQSVIQFNGSDFLMLYDDVESINAHHDIISEDDESSGRAGISSTFSSAHHARAKAFLGLDSFQVYTWQQD